MDKKPLPTLPEEPPEKTTSPKKVFAPSERSNRASPNSPKKDVKVVSSPPKPIKKESTARTNSSYSYSNQSVFGDDSNEPCSSAQAEARYRKNSDTGYSSMSPRPTIFSKFPSEAAAQNDSADEAKMEEARIAELKKKGSPKTLVDIFKMEANLIPKKKGEDTKSEKESKQKKAKVVRPENMPVTAPNFFAGQEYGFHLTEMVNRGTETLLIIYERDPEKFFKRFETKWYQRVMPLLFGKSHKTPAEIVKNLREVLIILDKLPPPKLDKDGNVVSDKKYDKSVEEVAKNVALIKNLIYGNEGSNSDTDHVVQVAQLAQEIYNANILPMVVKMLPKFEFECKKDVGQIFNNLLRRQIGTRSPTVEYLGARPEILVQLVQGYTNSDIALTCGLMLRESIRHDHLAKMILYSDVFYTFFHYVQSEVFDIASDAFATFKELTTRHKTLCAEFLETHYDTFFAQYQNLLNSKNYVTRRQSLKLLGELLLDRHNFNIMHKYISNPENMRVLMELLRDKSRNIQYEAFHVFKVFVANPNKSKPICDILLRNREKLVEFLGEFHNDRTDDEQFNDEKAYLIKQIQEMKGSPKEAKKHKTKEDELVTSVEAVTLADPTPSTSSQQ